MQSSANEGRSDASDSSPVVVEASPTKRFFVEMLTRDIELQDAVLDLLDNCIDGVLRSLGPDAASEKPYSGRWARVELHEDSFSIFDNCGGIPRDIAEHSAFRMGRQDESQDKDLPIVGMYGIGMKRAIFKLGRSAVVESQTTDAAYKVSITPEWLGDDDKWTLELVPTAPPFAEAGTRITVQLLHDPIRAQFTVGTSSAFVDQFREVVAQHYSFILAKGFSVFINGLEVQTRPIALLAQIGRTTASAGIAPYVFRGSVHDVDVFLTVGFYRPTPDDEEIDTEQEVRRSRDDAGWTVVCNDRVVVYKDKSRLTGWGEAGVPSYHNQFIAIAGIVFFRSSDPWRLPLTTTKRGVDASSDTYLIVKERMREGTKVFTSFTNRWKTRRDEIEKVFADAQPVPVEDVRDVAEKAPGTWTDVRISVDNGRRFVPSLPDPPHQANTRRIIFTKPIADIERVSAFLFEAPDRVPREVGEACFERVLRESSQ